MFRQKLFLMLLVSSLLLVTATLPPVPVSATMPSAPAAFLPQQQQSNAPTYTGLDILFAIDQSGSMGGVRYGGPDHFGVGNDPEDVRFAAPQYAVQWLSDFVNNIVTQKPLTVRFALFNFGDYTRPMLNWTTLDPQNPTWPAMQQRMLNDISQNRFGNINLGSTDFLEMLAMARNLFQNTPSLGPNQNHLSALVLMTDGAPCASMRNPDFDCESPVSRDAMRDLEQLINDAQTYLPNTEIYVIGLDAHNVYWSPTVRYWQRLACPDTTNCPPERAQQVHDSAESVLAFNTVLNALVTQVSGATNSEQVAYPPGEFFIAPYTLYARLSIFKTATVPLGNVELIQPDGTVMPNVNGVGFNTTIETYTVNAAAAPITPGMWRVNIPNYDSNLIASLELVSDTITAGAALQNMPPNVDMYAQTPVFVSVVDSGGVPLTRPPNGAYPLTVELLVYDATPLEPANRAEIERCTMQDDPNATSVTRFVCTWRPTYSGPVELRTNAYYYDDDGNRVDLLYNESLGELDIAAVSIIWAGPSMSSVKQGEPVSVALEMTRTADGTPLADMGNVTMRVTATDTNGAVVPGYDQALLPTTNTQPGRVESEINLPTSGQYTLAVEAGTVDDTGQFTPLNPNAAPQVYPVEVRPIHTLTLTITQPAEARMPAQEPGTLPQLWRDTDTVVQIELRDEQGQPVSLATVTDGQEQLPTLTIQQNGEPVTPTAPLQEMRDGVYILRTDEFGMGDFAFNASINTPSTALVGDYTLGTSRATANLNRYLAPFIPIGGGAIVLVVGGLLLGTYLYSQHMSKLKANPLSGSIILGPPDENGEWTPLSMQEIHLNEDRNTINLRKRKHALPYPFIGMTITNDGDESYAKNGTVIVRDLRMAQNCTVNVGDEIKLEPGQTVPVARTDENGEIVTYGIGNWSVSQISGETRLFTGDDDT